MVKSTGLLRFTSFGRNARGLIVWENNLGKWKSRVGKKKKKERAFFMMCMWFAWPLDQPDLNHSLRLHRPTTLQTGMKEGKGRGEKKQHF